MDTQFVRDRITQLRLKKGVSEYQMSYDLGHSRSYVYNISSGKSLPPMAEFLQICNYFDITPSQFFDESEENPALLQTAIEELRKLNDDSPNGLIRDSLPRTIRPATRMTRFSYSSLPMQWLWNSTKSNSSSPCWQQQKPPNTIRRTSMSISLAAWRSSAPKGH